MHSPCVERYKSASCMYFWFSGFYLQLTQHLKTSTSNTDAADTTAGSFQDRITHIQKSNEISILPPRNYFWQTSACACFWCPTALNEMGCHVLAQCKIWLRSGRVGWNTNSDRFPHITYWDVPCALNDWMHRCIWRSTPMKLALLRKTSFHHHNAMIQWILSCLCVFVRGSRRLLLNPVSHQNKNPGHRTVHRVSMCR